MTEQQPLVTLYRGSNEHCSQTVHGLTLFKDESGSNPKIVVEHLPKDWVGVNGKIRLNIALGVKKDDDDDDNVKTVPEPLRLSNIEDKRFNRTMRKRNMVETEYVQIEREAGVRIEIPLTKKLPLSSRFRGQSKELPLMYVHIVSECKTKSMYSDFFVIMSKRQPDVLGKQKRGATSATDLDTNGSKRQRRSDEIKALASDNHTLTAQVNMLSQDLKRKTTENEQMINLIKQLQTVGKIGLQSENKQDMLKCFMAAIDGTTYFHWMKEVQAPQTTALGGALGGSHQVATMATARL